MLVESIVRDEELDMGNFLHISGAHSQTSTTIVFYEYDKISRQAHTKIQVQLISQRKRSMLVLLLDLNTDEVALPGLLLFAHLESVIFSSGHPHLPLTPFSYARL